MSNITIRLTDSTKKKLRWLKADQELFWGDKMTYSEIIRIAIHQYWLQQNEYAWEDDPESVDPNFRELKKMIKEFLPEAQISNH